MRKIITKKSQKGFTLIEVLLVVTLIGILLAIGLVNFNTENRFIETRNDIRKTHIQTLESAITQYRLQEGNYPTGLSRNPQEICDPEATDCTGFFDLKEFLVPKYLESIPQDPNDTDTTGGIGYSVAVDETTNTISIRAIRAEANVEIKINDITIADPTTISNTPLAATVPNTPPISCPTGYIRVPGNSIYNTSDFCVMKYEAKTGSATVAATTQATGNPQVNISQTDAITACSLNGPGYGLITNAEWMTIARNIEGQSSNWTGGSVGSGGLWRGHSDNNPSNSLPANADDNLGYAGTGNTSPSVERRTHTISNGQVIWDLSGNVWEWTNDTILGQDKPNNGSGSLWQNWSVFNTGGSYGSLSYNLTRPSNPDWDTTSGSNENVGQYFAGGLTGGPFAFIRGGDWINNNDPIRTGIFTLYLDYIPNSPRTFIGFRCIFR
jgi:prepilin-type N-terminal cleavage/methylation domain-containing protein